MSRFLGFFSFITVFFLFLCIPSFAQDSRSELEKKREKIEDDISYTNKLLEETRKSKENTINELRLITIKLNNRNELIATVKKEVYLYDNEISETEASIENLNKDLKELRDEYAKVIYFAYKYKTSYNKLIYLFSSEDMNQGFQRMIYLDQIGEFIRTEANAI